MKLCKVRGTGHALQRIRAASDDCLLRAFLLNGTSFALLSNACFNKRMYNHPRLPLYSRRRNPIYNRPGYTSYTSHVPWMLLRLLRSDAQRGPPPPLTPESAREVQGRLMRSLECPAPQDSDAPRFLPSTLEPPLCRL